MRWRGRRESSNIIDLRNIPFSNLIVGWVPTNELNKISPGDYVVDTDGTVYLSRGIGQEELIATTFSRLKPISTRYLNILFIYNLNNQTLTNSQIKIINQVIELIPTNVKSNSIELHPAENNEENNYLLQVMQTALNNR